MNLLGYLGGILLAFCAIPEAYLAWKRKRSDLSWTFLGMWGIGEVAILIPVIFEIKVGFLLLNYSLNVILISVICFYKRKGELLAKRS